MSSKTVWGTLAIVAFATSAGVACSSGSVDSGIFGNRANDGIPNDDGIPRDQGGGTGDQGGVPGDGEGGGTQGGGSGRKLISSLFKCLEIPASCSDAEIDGLANCMTSSCDAELRATYGDGYASGNFGGACGEILTCTNACACGDTACLASCTEGVSEGALTACVDSQDALDACSSTCAKPSCGDDGDDDDKGGGTTTPTGVCAELAACCATLNESFQEYRDQCNAAAANGTEEQCSTIIDGLKDFCG